MVARHSSFDAPVFSLRVWPRWLALGFLALAVAACALGPDFRRPDPPAADSVLAPGRMPAAIRADGVEQRFDGQTALPARWWTLFSSPGMNALVQQALDHSPTVRAAQATLHQSEEDLKAGYGVFFPQIGASAAATRQASVLNLGRGPVVVGPYNLATLGANVSYVPDIFGGQRRSVEALAAQVEEQHYAVIAAYLSLTSNVANTAIAHAAYHAQYEATRASVRELEEQQQLAQVQYDAGISPYSAVLSLQAQHAASVALLATLEQRMDQSEHLLAQLCGATPREFAAPSLALADIHLPARMPQTVPSALARRRPDILAAEAALHRASAQIGIATADLFPSLTLGASGGEAHVAISQLLHAGTRFWSAQAALSGYLFSGGSQWYARKAALQAYDAALAQYQQVVLEALEQVADTMRALVHDAQALQAQVDALTAATQNAQLTRARYEAGSAGYLDVLNADAQLQQARVAYQGAVAQRLQDSVALYAALGGGWWEDPANAALAPAAVR